jgi:hypothetical protein
MRPDLPWQTSPLVSLADFVSCWFCCDAGTPVPVGSEIWPAENSHYANLLRSFSAMLPMELVGVA